MDASSSSRLSAVLAYIPVLGWLYVLLFARRDAFAVFHLKQSIGLFLFLILVFLGWAVIAWLLAWIPFAVILSTALFALVIAAFVYGVIAWVAGAINAGRGRATPLPLGDQIARKLPI